MKPKRDIEELYARARAADRPPAMPSDAGWVEPPGGWGAGATVYQAGVRGGPGIRAVGLDGGRGRPTPG